MLGYITIPISILVGYVIGKYVFSSNTKKQQTKQRFKMINYSQIYNDSQVKELLEDKKDKNDKKEIIKSDDRWFLTRLLFRKKEKVDPLLETEKKEIAEISEIAKKVYLFFDFDQMNDESKMNIFTNKKCKSTFGGIEFFVSYVISNFDPVNTEILIRISSPGGYAYLFERARDYLLRLKNHGFMTTAFVDDVCASGGYMLACACQKIICTETSKIGSVGVLTTYINFHDLLEKIGITKKMIGTSEHKHLPNFTGEKQTEKHEELIKEEIDYTLDMFLKIVSQARPNIDIELVKTAKVWYGNDALNNKLVDEINNIDDYLLTLSKEKTRNNIIYLVYLDEEEEEKSLFDIVIKKFLGKKVMNYIC
jgi:signal peptide peptidase SppA